MQFLVCAKFIYLFIINNTSIATIRDFTNLYVRLGAFAFHKTLEDFLISFVWFNLSYYTYLCLLFFNNSDLFKPIIDEWIY